MEANALTMKIQVCLKLFQSKDYNHQLATFAISYALMNILLGLHQMKMWLLQLLGHRLLECKQQKKIVQKSWRELLDWFFFQYFSK